MKKPNILFIMSDQMRHDVLGCNGNSYIRTPNYDLQEYMKMRSGL